MRFLGLTIAVALAGCGSDFDPSSRVVGTRVLAVRADQPYARPGETVNLEALAFDTKGRTLTWAWTTCLNPASATAVACFQRIAEDTAAGRPPALVLGASQTKYATTVPTDALSRLPAEARGAAYLGVLIVTCPGTLDFGKKTGDLPFACIEAGRALALEEFEVGVKRIFLREKDRNANPIITSVTFDGAPWPETEIKRVGACSSATENRYDRCDGDKHTVAAQIDPKSLESGVDELGQPFQEDLVVQHYATEGLFEYDARIGTNTATGWVARASAKGTTVNLWFVARDNRGGMSWVVRQAKVE